MSEGDTGIGAGGAREERVGVTGLGIIGSVWAANYEADGLLAATWNRSPKPHVPRAVDSASSVVHVGRGGPTRGRRDDPQVPTSSRFL